MCVAFLVGKNKLPRDTLANMQTQTHTHTLVVEHAVDAGELVCSRTLRFVQGELRGNTTWMHACIHTLSSREGHRLRPMVGKKMEKERGRERKRGGAAVLRRGHGEQHRHTQNKHKQVHTIRLPFAHARPHARTHRDRTAPCVHTVCERPCRSNRHRQERARPSPCPPPRRATGAESRRRWWRCRR
jgi:hypothetical protein